ncbi:MAG: hypothetical protein JJ863_05725 [Deltaproteobacteria bacterium]|nr:hypothetical protein [Deltaproteobacteria bacterium]
MGPGTEGSGGSEAFVVRHRFEDRFRPSGKGFEARRILYRQKRVDQSYELDRSHFVENEGKILRKLKRGVAVWLRALGRSLLLAPLAWLVELIGPYVGMPRGWGVVGLVIWTVTFFAFLNIYVWLAMLEYFRRRRMSIERPFDAEGEDRRGLLPPASQAIVGKVAALGPSGAGEVYREAWLDGTDDEGRFTRRVSGGDHFVVVPDDGSPPLVCDIEGPPLIVGPSEREAMASTAMRALFPDTFADGDAETVVLRVGDAVAVHAEELRDLPRVDHVELDGVIRSFRPGEQSDAPYRGGGARPGRRAISAMTKPLRIRKLR